MRAAWLVICVASTAGASERGLNIDLRLRWDTQLLERLRTPPPRTPAPAHAASPESPPNPHWVHPLAKRALPGNSSRKFGASRPFRRPKECRRGHCGVDLGSTLGDPVFAVYDGIVERIERDAKRAPRSGRYIRLGHEEGSLVSRYIHLDSVRDDLAVGDRVKSGDLIGRLGSTGIYSTGPHLHFSLSLREGAGERYFDPEPLLQKWDLPSWPPKPKPALAAAPPPKARWIPEHWIWVRGRWLWQPAAWRVPRSGPSPVEFVAFWVSAHWQWTGASWIWIHDGWRVENVKTKAAS